jgi:hypothetical protein
MKEILENIFDKKIEHITFNQSVRYTKQRIGIYPKQYTEVDSEEPTYVIKFLDGSIDELNLSELIVKIFNYK